MISKMTEPYIHCENISNPDRKRQFNIEMISKMTEPYIFCEAIQIPTEKDSSVVKFFKDDTTLHPLQGHFKSKEKSTVQY